MYRGLYQGDYFLRYLKFYIGNMISAPAVKNNRRMKYWGTVNLQNSQIL